MGLRFSSVSAYTDLPRPARRRGARHHARAGLRLLPCGAFICCAVHRPAFDIFKPARQGGRPFLCAASSAGLCGCAASLYLRCLLAMFGGFEPCCAAARWLSSAWRASASRCAASYSGFMRREASSMLYIPRALPRQSRPACPGQRLLLRLCLGELLLQQGALPCCSGAPFSRAISPRSVSAFDPASACCAVSSAINLSARASPSSMR